MADLAHPSPSSNARTRSPQGASGRLIDLARIVANEVAKGMRNFWVHRAAIGMGMATFGALYLGMMLIIGQGELPEQLLPLTVIGMAAYAALWIGSLQLVSDQLEQMRAGTLEQTHLSPAPPSLLVTGRLLATGLQGVVVAAALVLTVMLATDIALGWRWGAVLPIALTLVQVLAFSLLFAGITLTVPFVGEVHHVAVSLIAFFNGAFLPVDQLPGWLRTLARTLPTTVGVETTIDMLIGGHSLAEVVGDGRLLYLIGYTAALTVIAFAVYVRNYRRALSDGDLGRY